MLNKISSTRNYLTFIRSANDNKSDIEKYLTVCDDFIPKAAVSFNFKYLIFGDSIFIEQ